MLKVERSKLDPKRFSDVAQRVTWLPLAMQRALVGCVRDAEGRSLRWVCDGIGADKGAKLPAPKEIFAFVVRCHDDHAGHLLVCIAEFESDPDSRGVFAVVPFAPSVFGTDDLSYVAMVAAELRLARASDVAIPKLWMLGGVEVSESKPTISEFGYWMDPRVVRATVRLPVPVSVLPKFVRAFSGEGRLADRLFTYQDGDFLVLYENADAGKAKR